MVKMLKRVIRNYWLAEETNIFRNYRDVLAGFVALVIIPAVSIFLYYLQMVIRFGVIHFRLYLFRWLVRMIHMEDIMDTLPKMQSLLFDWYLISLQFFFATLSVGNNNTILPYVAPVLLFVCGLFWLLKYIIE